jgi:hypothetical protein
MQKLLTHENVEALKSCLTDLGLLTERNPTEVHAVCTKLFGLVEVVVREAVDKATLEMKAAALLAAYDALDEQRQKMFAGMTAQFCFRQ